MPNLQGACLVGRDNGDRLYAAQTTSRSRLGRATSWGQRNPWSGAEQQWSPIRGWNGTAGCATEGGLRSGEGERARTGACSGASAGAVAGHEPAGRGAVGCWATEHGPACTGWLARRRWARAVGVGQGGMGQGGGRGTSSTRRLMQCDRRGGNGYGWPGRTVCTGSLDMRSLRAAGASDEAF